MTYLLKFTLLFLLLFGCEKLKELNTSDQSFEMTDLTYMSPKNKNVKWPSLPIHLCLHHDIPSNIKSDIKDAAEAWEDQLKTKIFDLSCLTKISHNDSDHKTKGIYWIKSQFAKFTKKTALARTIIQYTDEGEIIDADILINGEFYDWKNVNVDPKTVFIHELGHVLGLKHLFISSTSAMNYFPYVTGYKHHTLGDYEKSVFAAQYLNQNISLQPYIKSYLGGKNEKALNLLNQITNKNTEDLYALGYIYKSLNNWTKAKLAFKEVLSKEPKNLMAQYHYAESVWLLGDLAEAKNLFKKILKESPKHYESMMNLGVMAIENNHNDKAVDYLKGVLTIQPTHWLACKYLFELTSESQFNDCFKKFAPKGL